eukprot:506883_1
MNRILRKDIKSKWKSQIILFQNLSVRQRSTSYFPDGDDYSDYLDISRSRIDEIERENSDARYVSIKARKDSSLLPLQTIVDIQQQKQQNFFKTATLLKDPFDESILRQLLFDIKPKTIFEFGTFTGSSSNYMAMLLNEYGLYDSKILSFDKYEEFRHKSLDNTNYIEYLICDLSDDWNKIDALKPYKLKEYEHPWIIVEDAHVDVEKMLNYFDCNGIQNGDYIIVEDTTPGLGDDNKKVTHLRTWMTKNEDKGYMVDTKYCDLWGYNVTWNANGYITKRKPPFS